MNNINSGGLLELAWFALLFFGVLAIPFTNYSDENRSHSWKSGRHKMIYWILSVVIWFAFLSAYNFDFSKISNIFTSGSRCDQKGNCWDGY